MSYLGKSLTYPIVQRTVCGICGGALLAALGNHASCVKDVAKALCEPQAVVRHDDHGGEPERPSTPRQRIQVTANVSSNSTSAGVSIMSPRGPLTVGSSENPIAFSLPEFTNVSSGSILNTVLFTAYAPAPAPTFGYGAIPLKWHPGSTDPST